MPDVPPGKVKQREDECLIYNHSKNPSVIYSLNALADAMERLMRTIPCGEITVLSICDEAKVSRNSFYNNLKNKDDLILYMIDRKLKALYGQIDQSRMSSYELMLRLYQFWYAERGFLGMFVRDGIYDRFHLRFIEFGEDRAVYPSVQAVNDEEAKQILNAFIIGGIAGVLKKWACLNFTQPPEQLAKITQTAFFENFRQDIRQ